MNILFLCTGNSCRSQMAEGFLRHLAGDRVGVDSAGIEAHGQNPRAVAVMDEVGVDIYQQQSTRLSDKHLEWRTWWSRSAAMRMSPVRCCRRAPRSATGGCRTRQKAQGQRRRLCSSSVPFGMTSGHGLNP